MVLASQAMGSGPLGRCRSLAVYLTLLVVSLSSDKGASAFLCSREHPRLQCSSLAVSQVDPPKRKRKKNKYENFSKVEKDIDPLDVLMAESEAKKRDMEQQAAEATRPKRIELDPLGKLDFPNNRDINPYDPTSFGYVEVGTITGAHGVHGWLKVKSTTDFAEVRLCQPGRRHLKPANKRAPRQVVLVDGKHRHEDEYLIQLEDVMDRDEAKRLRGAVLYVREEEKVDHEADEFMLSDLVDKEVFLLTNEDGEEAPFVGVIAGVVLAEDMCSIPGLGHDMLEIVLLKGRGRTPSLKDELVLVPMVKEIVPRVEVDAVYIDPPTGLLDLTYVREEKVRIKGFLPPARD